MKRPRSPPLSRRYMSPFWVSKLCSEYSSRGNKNEMLYNLDQKMFQHRLLQSFLAFAFGQKPRMGVRPLSYTPLVMVIL